MAGGTITCGNSDSSGADAQISTIEASISSGNCMAQCTTRAVQCGAPNAATAASKGCNDICAVSPSDEQIRCLATSTCNDLMQSFSSHDPLCGINFGKVDAGVLTGDNGTGPSNTCPSDYPRCEDNSVVECIPSSKGNIIQKTNCLDKKCSNGKCVDYQCLPLLTKGCSSSDPAKKCCAPAECDGSNQTCCVFTGGECTNRTECCGSENPATQCKICSSDDPSFACPKDKVGKQVCGIGFVQ